jgi:hypothetical protein
MKVVMDADCLIKLTKAGAKETVISAIEVHIPLLVKKEIVDEAKMRGYQDAFFIEENINRKVLHVISYRGKRPPALSTLKGEADVLALYDHGEYDAIASDDRKFIKRLEATHIPYVTPAACLVYLSKTGRLGAATVLEMLESLSPFISREEYSVAKLYLEAKS